MKIIGGDISNGAVKVAKGNSKLNDTEKTCTFINSDHLSAFKNGSADMIVSNPPYIPDNDYDKLQAEVRKFEPRVALLGGDDGLDHYRRLIPASADVLKSGGWLVMEFGIEQAGAIKRMLEENSFSCIEIKKDLNGIERIIRAQWKSY